MIDEHLKQLVRDEAAKLREFATGNERSNLNTSKMRPTNPHLCIYGLMTGYCRSPRAVALLKKCAKPLAKNHGSVWYDAPAGSRQSFTASGQIFYSPIEVYICQRRAENKKLISYLKGETETLDI